jgi:hypothetical protein
MMVLSVLAALVAVLGSGLAWWNLRRIKTSRLAAAIPGAVRDEVLAAIDRAGMEDGTRVLLLRVVAGKVTDPYSRMGGKPLQPKAMTVDLAADDLGAFLGQVLLRSPPLPEVWSNRVIFLFRDATGKVVAHCAGRADAVVQSGAHTLTAGERGIEPLRLPPGDIAHDEDGEVWTSSP